MGELASKSECKQTKRKALSSSIPLHLGITLRLGLPSLNNLIKEIVVFFLECLLVDSGSSLFIAQKKLRAREIKYPVYRTLVNDVAYQVQVLLCAH